MFVLRIKKSARLAIVLGSILSGLSSTSVYAENLLQVYEHAKQNDAQLKISEVGFLATLEKSLKYYQSLKPRVRFRRQCQLQHAIHWQ